ncbi:MAG TPA: glycosyltransferase [Thermodesulfovibrionales bacterium]|nr:glycosyltransferase [Thermodesulfovibrionales bacterium]
MPQDDTYITVCICTYNRAESLSATLESLSALNIDSGLYWEVLLVDNNSSDNTRSVSEGFSDRLPLRYVFEPKQGLSNSRNRAISECRSDILLFTDDDVIVDTLWLKEFADAAQKFPGADFFGGRILPHWPNGRPSWLRDEPMPLLSGLFVWYDLGQNTRLYAHTELLPYGASFAIRRRLFEQLEPFRTDLGVLRNTPGRGEEAEYLSRARSAGYVGVYVGKAACHHRVDPVRLNLAYMYRFGVQKGIAEVTIRGRQNSGGTLFEEMMYGVRGLFQLLKGRGDRFRQCVINMGIQRGLRQS